MSCNTALEQVCETANSLFPELNLRPNELAHPTEALLTNVLIHYLRSFGFQVEPPDNVESEGNDASKEKRKFLTKLCRQVERIVQITFPGKTFRYIDIIEPNGRKILNTLDVLFNYKCFYNMHKKEVIAPIADQYKERQELNAAITSKRSELEQSKQEAEQVKIDIVKSQETIARLEEELPRVEEEMIIQSKLLKQKQNEIAAQEETLAEMTTQVNQLKQLLVQESDVESVQSQINQIKRCIMSSKEEMATQEKLYNERRQDIETNLALNEEIVKAMKILPPEVISSYVEKVKLRQRVEKKYAALESKHHSLLAENEKQQNLIDQCQKKLKALKVQYEQETQATKQKIVDEEAAINQKAVSIEEAEQRKNVIQDQINEEHDTQEYMKKFVTKAFEGHSI